MLRTRDTEDDMPYYAGRMNRLAQQLSEDRGRFERLMSDPVTVISEHDDPGEKAYLAHMFRLNERAREHALSRGRFDTSVLVERWKRGLVSDHREWRLAKRELGALLDLCWGIDGEAGALHHRYERQKKYGNDISWYERPETEAEIRAFALAVVDELDRRGPDATERERLFIKVESYETRLIARGEMRYRPVADR
jgi:hypothetical protein